MKPSVFADPDNLPGIVLHQPYAGLVRLAALGFDGKSIETRGTRIHYRGPLVIVAGRELQVLAFDKISHLPLTQQRECGHVGVAVALFDVADCRPLRSEAEQRSWFFEPGRHAWMASRIRPLRPFPVRGAQGFVRVPRAQVTAAIEGPGWLFCPSCGKRYGPSAFPAADELLTCSECGRAWRVDDAPAQGALFEGSAQ